MPVLMSPDIAAKFKEKWLSVYPEDQAGGTGDDSAHLDDSLTSLNWLQNFCILSADPEERWNGCPPSSSSSSSQQQLLCLRRLGFPQGGGSDSPSSPPAGDTAATGMPLYLGSPVTSGSDSSADPARTLAGYGRVTGSSGYHHHHHHHPHLPLQPSPPAEVDYKTNPKVKPPYSYASLICMAMQASKQPKVTLSTIYNWITENFCYYRHAEPSWQNSIRHNLSLNKCFMKVPRQKDEPGKGGFWQIDPQYADMFVNGIFKRRRMSANHYNSSSNGHRQSKLLQGHDTVGYHQSQSGCLYQGEVGMSSTKRKYLSTKGNSDRNHNKAARMTPKSPLLATEAHGADMLRGDFDLASVFDDVLGGNCSNFEDLDINTALVSLGCEMEVSSSAVHHGHGTSMELGLQGRWCGANGSEGVDLQSQASSHHQQSYGYMELSGAAVDCHATMGDLQMLQQHPHHDQLLQPHHHHHQQHHHHHHPLHQFEEVSSLFLEQPEEVVVHPWGEIKEEEQVIPLTLDQGFGLCEGFFTEMQPWERVEAYL